MPLTSSGLYLVWRFLLHDMDGCRAVNGVTCQSAKKTNSQNVHSFAEYELQNVSYRMIHILVCTSYGGVSIISRFSPPCTMRDWT